MVVIDRGNQLAKGGTTAVNPPNTVVPYKLASMSLRDKVMGHALSFMSAV